MSVKDRCMVCTRRTIGSEIVLDATDGTTRYKAQVEAHFGPCWRRCKWYHYLEVVLAVVLAHFGSSKWYHYLEVVLASVQDRCMV